MGLSQYRGGQRRPDWLVALLAVGLAAFGLTMILSASAYLAGTTGDIYHFVTRQLISLAIGLVIMVIVAYIDYRVWKHYAGVILGMILFALVAVFVSPECRGVHRCLDLGPVQFQPAEFVKVGLLIYLAAWFHRLELKVADFRQGFLPFFLLLGTIGGLIFLQPDMGTAVTIILAALLLYFLAGAAWHHLLLGGAVGIGLLILLIMIAPYRLERLQTYLNPSADPQGTGYQTNQISIAIGSGGLWGLGFGQGKLKYLGYVPEVHTDSIFAVVVEELGFVRAVAVLGVFLILILRAFRIAKTAADSFGRYLASGLTGFITIQVFINLAAMLSIVPLTGIPLPLVSYGGSSLVAVLVSIGLILSVSRTSSVPA